MTRAKIILDSISPDGHRLTTFEVKYHRYMLPEMNTHRKFSRNTASSRAISYAKMRQSIIDDPAFPSSWRLEKKGMQGGELLSAEDQELAGERWLVARDQAIKVADELHGLGVHKSTVNRILEPFQYVTSIISATDFSGFFDQRCNPQAQDDIRIAAEAMRAAYDASTPRVAAYGVWHCPYITPEDIAQADEMKIYGPERQELFKQISVARCARVSYLTQDGKREWDKDLILYNRLITAVPGHWSPAEHVATPENPATTEFFKTPGNFYGWTQLRHHLEYPELFHEIG